ncbi:MAG: MTH1187 family thiamine-binding protein [Spirochaetia bacterium]|nr:MTH1187 family thiamine-binding protein [Spirochaetia bacterium]
MKKRDTLLEFSMTPLDKGESVSAYVSRSIDIIDKSGLEYKLNPMGTVVEGTWEEVLQVMTDCYKKMSSDCERISVHVKIDYRKGKTGRLGDKIKSIENKLGREIKK